MTGSSSNHSSAYDFTVKDIRGNDVDLSIYKGKVLLIVNFGCQCEMPNSRYNELNAVYTKYKDQELKILGLCNQSGGQKPGDNVQTAELACTRFEAEFPIFDKVEVNCQDIYEFLKPKSGESRKDGLFPTFSYGLKLKFSKFLVDKDGNVKGYFASESLMNMEKDIKKLLGIA